jgi:hypothetical protein
MIQASTTWSRKMEAQMAQPDAKNTALVLRCCRSDMTSNAGFTWPGVGGVAQCDDWNDNGDCGNGLHGWLYGQGDHTSSDFWSDAGAKWLVVEVAEADIRMLGGKCKFPRGTVRFVGGRVDAAAYLIQHEPRAANVAVIGAVVSVGDGQAVAAGAVGTATAGDRGTICIRWYDAKAVRYRTAVGYVGEDGIQANVAYHLDDDHKFVKSQP